MKNIKTFESYGQTNDKKTVLPEKDQKQVEYYIEKYSDKMQGSTRGTAAWWVDGITELSDDVKRAVWAGIQQYIPKRPFPMDKAELPDWMNESINEGEVRIVLDEDDFKTLVSGGEVNGPNYKIILSDIGFHNMGKIIVDAEYEARKGGGKWLDTDIEKSHVSGKY